MAPRLHIYPASSVPVYRQIADGLRRHLVDGSLKPGDVLPPVRQVAVDLGVHFNTVAQAYRALADEGWLELKRRRGALVLHRHSPPAPDKKQVTQILRRLGDLAAELRTAGLSQSQVALAFRRVARGQAP